MTQPPRARAALGGLALFASAAAALLWANLDPHSYAAVFTPSRQLINDGLMALFFFVVGMEIKHELVDGALSSRARALLPGVAALGGMAVPALIFATLNPGGRGWGVPTSTDIAFCAGVLALLASRVPRALVVFITALAVFDDIGGIAIIAVFYGHGVDGRWLVIAGCIAAALWMLERVVRLDGLVYVGLGVVLWYAMHRSGVHATAGGVLLGLVVPARALADPLPAAKAVTPDEPVALQRFTTLWQPWVTWLVLPLFALANTGVALGGLTESVVSSPISLGVALGLVLGKPIGIFSVTLLAVLLGLAPMPEGSSWRLLLGAAMVAGIGFTVALFIAALAYPAGAELEQAKSGVLVGSLVAGVLGALLLRGAAPLRPARKAAS